ncbi:hypothetical protein ROLI_046470 (plasmid) [Roseobacter fucihabitans]|uniref:Uncharacterized protein n=1 Tax=Roseobacter fucihabitans TaxID=1537242 RepID=A0ABZ2BZJ0_9RHOB|nr:hypothetical protein [Roseobacter litoralis]
MYLVRILLVVLVTFSTSLTNAMDAGHMPVSDHDHATVEAMEDARPLCCQDSTERAQTCHALLALLPTLSFSGAAPVAGEDVFCKSGVLLTGFEPSGPLDPPRTV